MGVFLFFGFFSFDIQKEKRKKSKLSQQTCRLFGFFLHVCFFASQKVIPMNVLMNLEGTVKKKQSKKKKQPSMPSKT